MSRDSLAPRSGPGRRVPRSGAAWLAIAAAGLAGACQRRDRDAAPAEPAGGGTRTASTAGAEPARFAPALSGPLPGARSDLTAAVGKAERAVIADLDGDGRSELVVADAQRLRVLDASGQERASAPAPGGIQILAIAP